MYLKKIPPAGGAGGFVGTTSSQCSKSDFASELNDATRTSGKNLAKSRIVGIIADRCTNVGRGVGVKAVLCMVEHVKGFRAELKGDPLGELEVLANPKVPVVNARTADYVSTGITELAGKRLDKARCIEPLIDALVETAVWTATRYHVGPLSKSREQAECVIS